MDGFDVVDEVVDQSADLGAEESEVVNLHEVNSVDQPEQQAGESDNKFSKRFTAWLKGKNESLDPEDKYNARFAKDLYGRDLALRQIYPNGVNDVREVKAALDGIQHGELRGVEAHGGDSGSGQGL